MFNCIFIFFVLSLAFAKNFRTLQVKIFSNFGFQYSVVIIYLKSELNCLVARSSTQLFFLEDISKF